MTRQGVSPGTFNPPTVGHLAILEAAIDEHRLDRLDLVVSRLPLGKAHAERPLLEHRLDVIEASISHLDGVRVDVTELKLIADIAAPYDVVVMGADKWRQVNDVRFYADRASRDNAVARLPTVAVAERGDDHVPPELALRVGDNVHHVSSTAARAGDTHLMTPAARRFDQRSGAWTDPHRYEAFLARRHRG